MMKRTKLIPCPTVVQHERIMKFLQPLFDQVGQLRTNSHLQQWPGTSSCKVNRHAVEQRGATTSQWSDLIRNRVEALRWAMCHPAFSPITLRTQVKNNLSWLLGRFAQKYWAISDQIVCKSSQEGNLAPESRGRVAPEWQSQNFSSPAVEENQSNSADPKKEDWKQSTDLARHVKSAFYPF